MDSHRGKHAATGVERVRPAVPQNRTANRYGAQSDRYRKRRRAHRWAAPVAAVLAVVAIAAIALAVLNPFGLGGQTTGNAEEEDAGFTVMDFLAPENDQLPTPIMAESSGVQLHCAVEADDLTEILIHNASYGYACAITTELQEATNVDVMAAHGTGRDAASQPTGDSWMTGQFIRCYRSGNAGPTMSAIDCGASAGTQVYAPVSGTVVLVKQYPLYDKYEDYQIHIQPTGHPELDVVLIHVTDPSVQAGDTVEAGVTPLASVRDVYALIGEEMELKQYTAEGDNGNHVHIQVNDATNPEYHGLDDIR